MVLRHSRSGQWSMYGRRPARGGARAGRPKARRRDKQRTNARKKKTSLSYHMPMVTSALAEFTRAQGIGTQCRLDAAHPSTETNTVR